MKKIPLIIFILLFFVSCSGGDEIYKANRKLINMNSYKSDAKIHVYGKKGTLIYKVRQYYKADDKLRVEILEPDFLKGKITLFNNKKCVVYHPLIGQSIEIEDSNADDRFTNLGMMQKSVLGGEKAEYKSITRDGIGYIQIKSLIYDGNEYRKSAILYMLKDGHIPSFMEIFDEKERVVVFIKYSNFDYNCILEDSLFKLE